MEKITEPAATRLLTVEEVAEAAGVGVATVWRALAAGALPVARRGRPGRGADRTLVEESDVDGWCKARAGVVDFATVVYYARVAAAQAPAPTEAQITAITSILRGA